MPSHFWEDATGLEDPRAGDRDREAAGFLLCIFLFLLNLEVCNNVLPIQKKKKQNKTRKQHVRVPVQGAPEQTCPT